MMDVAMLSSSHRSLSHDQVRALYPSLSTGFGFFDNAGGSQIPIPVLEAIHSFFLERNVQSGGGYRASQEVTGIVQRAHEWINDLFGGTGLGSVVIGQSATALLTTLSHALRHRLHPGDQIIVSKANHESNIGPWVRLAEFGVEVVWWEVDPESGLSDLDALKSLITERTKLICYPRTSNLLGDIQDCRAIQTIAESVGAWTIVDAVASGSHEALDVRAWGCDFCVVSHYKIFGPHVGSLWGKDDHWHSLKGEGHYFQSPTSTYARFELGCLPYELLAGILELKTYFELITGNAGLPARELVEAAYKHVYDLEKPITSILMDWANSRADLRILGSTCSEGRHPTLSIVPKNIGISELESKVHEGPFGVKSGHFYAPRLCESVGVDPATGVLRISAVHHNHPEETTALTQYLDRALDCLTP